MNSIEAKEMIQQFENGTWPKERWTHHAHFVMALWYCFHLPFPLAVRQIKEGIKKYNLCTGGQNTADSGYHETITVFYTRMIVIFIQQSDVALDLEALLQSMHGQPFLEKDFLSAHYSAELLKSREARQRWIAPDRTVYEKSL